MALQATASLVFGAVLGLRPLTTFVPEVVLGRYPQAVTLRQSVHAGQGSLIVQDSTYASGDALPHVAAWYARRYHVDLDYARVMRGDCVRLEQVMAFSVARQIIGITICPFRGGTHVLFNQTLYPGA